MVGDRNPGHARRAVRPVNRGRRFRPGWDRGGTFVIAAEIFHAVRGYDEALQGWGSEDADLCGRCAARTREAKFGTFLLTPIGHSHAERVRYHKDKDIGASNARNQHYLSRRQRLVNPQGYGRGEFTIFRGQGDDLPRRNLGQAASHRPAPAAAATASGQRIARLTDNRKLRTDNRKLTTDNQQPT